MSPEVRLREELSSYQSPLDMSHSYSINTIPSMRDYIISEDLLAGQRLDGRMSNVRRFFCLFVTFDFLFISLMWLICVMLNGENIAKALSEQILHYDIHTSLFDIVLVALSRFSVLILFYAIVYINHWIVISLSTALSCAFLIGKVFMFDWPKSSQPVFEVLLVLASFILSWGEAWFLDFRVIPQETHANRYLITATESERAPLIRSYVQGLPSACTESVANFYSPMVTPEGSLFNPESEHMEVRSVQLTKEQEKEIMIRSYLKAIYGQSCGKYTGPSETEPEIVCALIFLKHSEDSYKHLGARSLQSTWDLYQKSDWKLERKQDSDHVFSRKCPKSGTYFKLETEITVSPKYLLEELFFEISNIHKWSSMVKESHKVQAIDEYTDIVYQVTESGAGGLISSRDFVNLRHWAFIEEKKYVISSVKCDHPTLPPNSKFVRGENEVGGYIIETIADEDNRCRFTWILNTKLNVKIPKFILDKEIVKMMFLFSRELRAHLDNLKTSN